jgi:serine/threonine-protein kinase HipA
MLMAPGSSLGGARPKAGVLDPQGNLWIAKFPSRHDGVDIGGWETVVHTLATWAGVVTPAGMAKVFSGRQHTYLTQRFDRTAAGERLHFASAMTLLGRQDGDDASTGVSYLELAEFIIQRGAHVDRDLHQLWRRIVFYMAVSNVDDHLRNHGFLLTAQGWALSPAFDMNPVESAEGLKLNVSENDNSQDIGLAEEIAPFFRVKSQEAKQTIRDVFAAIRPWRRVAKSLGLSSGEQNQMERAFRLVKL